jgi:hypothetical protein
VKALLSHINCTPFDSDADDLSSLLEREPLGSKYCLFRFGTSVPSSLTLVCREFSDSKEKKNYHFKQRKLNFDYIITYLEDNFYDFKMILTNGEIVEIPVILKRLKTQINI